MSLKSCAPIFVFDNLWTSANIASSAAPVAGLPLENTQMTWGSRYARFNKSGTGITLRFDFPATRYVDSFWLPVPSICNVKVTLYAGKNGTGVVMHKSAILPTRDNTPSKGPAAPNFVEPYYLDNAVPCLSGDIWFDWAATKADYIDFSNVMIGRRWQPTYGSEVGMSVLPVTSQEYKRTLGGSLISIGPLIKWLEVKLDLKAISSSERADFWSLLVSADKPNIYFDGIPADPGYLRGQYLLFGKIRLPQLTDRRSSQTITDITIMSL